MSAAGYIVQCQNHHGLNGAMKMAKDKDRGGKPWRLFFASEATLFRTRRRARVLVQRTIKINPEFEGKLFITRLVRDTTSL